MKWCYSSTALSVNEAIVTITADVAPAWHLYSQKIMEGGSQPTRIRFDPDNDYLLSGNTIEFGKGHTYYDDVYEMEITWYSGVVSFIQKIKFNQPVNIEGKVEYMICNNEVCIPSIHEFNINVNPWNKTP